MKDLVRFVPYKIFGGVINISRSAFCQLGAQREFEKKAKLESHSHWGSNNNVF